FLLQKVLKRIELALNDPDYALYLHTAPCNQPELSYYHWHLQIEPVTEAVVAGFEKGSGTFINPRTPEAAAEDLRKVL
ncbi:MAG: galactose-1-phosphate uridylyltransferase, partial [Patescibacteria group bacterium]